MKNFRRNLLNRINAILFGVFIVSVSAASLYAIVAFNKAILKSGNETAELISIGYAESIKSEIDKAVYTAGYTARSVITPLSQKNKSHRRLTAGYALEKTLDLSSNTSAAYFMFEPGEYEKNDSVKLESKPDNAYVYRLRRNEGNLDALKDSDFKLDKQLFEKIRRTGQVHISQPFFVRYGEKDKPAVAVNAPVYYKNKFYGVAGINYMLNEVHNIVNTPQGGLTGTKILLLSKAENILFVSGKDWLSTKKISEYPGEEYRLYEKSKRAGELSETENIAFAQKIIRSVQDQEWKLYVFIPQKTIVSGLLNDVLRVVISSAFIVLLLSFSAVYFINKSLGRLKAIEKQTAGMASGNPSKQPAADKEDELARITNNLNKVSSLFRLQEKALGKLIKEDFEPTEPLDKLNHPIDKLRLNMKSKEEKHLAEKEDARVQLWTRKGRFEVADAQRKNPHELKKLSDNILKAVTDYVSAVVSGLYFHHTDVTPSYLQLLSAYAYGDKKHLTKKITIGEGLVGTCAREKKKTISEKLDENYLTVTTGLNKIPPKFLLLVPILYQDKVIAVCEYIFLKKPEDYKLHFIEQLSQNIAGWLDTAVSSTKTKKFLKLSQEQTDALSDKEAELNKQLSKMKNLQKENDKRAAEMQSMLNALNHTLMKVEYLPDGTILDANELYLQTMGFRLKDIKGKNAFDLVKDKVTELKNIVNRVKSGKSIERHVSRIDAKGREHELFASYTPFYNSDGEFERIIFFAFDISKLKKRDE